MKIPDWLLAGVVLMVLALVLGNIWMKQQEEAREADALRNMRQWGIALNLHLMDNDNRLPEVGYTPVDKEQTNAWFNALPLYISQTPLAALPEGERPRPGVPSLWMNPRLKPRRIWDPSEFFFAYGMNRYLQPDPSLRSFTIPELGHPSQIIFLSEQESFSPALEPRDVVTLWGKGRPNSPTSEAFVLFCDGHVERIPRSRLVDIPSNLGTEHLSEGGISWFKE